MCEEEKRIPDTVGKSPNFWVINRHEKVKGRKSEKKHE